MPMGSRRINDMASVIGRTSQEKWSCCMWPVAGAYGGISAHWFSANNHDMPLQHIGVAVAVLTVKLVRAKELLLAEATVGVFGHVLLDAAGRM